MPTLSSAIIKRIADNRTAALMRKQAVNVSMPSMPSVVPPSADHSIRSALKENIPALPEAIIQRMAENRAAALKRKQTADAEITNFTPRCRAKLELSIQAENVDMILKTEEPPAYTASIGQSTAPATKFNCTCIQCAGVRAKPIVAKCVLCDASVVYSICELHYPNTLEFHKEVQARSRSIFCFPCKTIMDT